MKVSKELMGKKKSAGLLSQANPNNSPVKILPYLYLGPRSATAPDIALNKGITHIISVGTKPDQGHSSITYHHLGLEDTTSADLTTPALLATEIINNAKANPDAKVLVHCVAAVSRSPAIIASYLISEQGMTLHQALVTLVRAREHIRPNDGFLAQLKEFELKHRGEESISFTTMPNSLTKKLEALGIGE